MAPVDLRPYLMNTKTTTKIIVTMPAGPSSRELLHEAATEVPIES